MATLKQRLHRKNSSGTYDTIHLETSADMIVGSVAIANGGTGATTAANARTNLGITPANIGAAASSHTHSAANITSGTLPVTRGGTGVTSNPSMLVNLGSASAASIFATSPRPGVTGTLPVTKGGTGVTSLDALKDALGISDDGGSLNFEIIKGVKLRPYETTSYNMTQYRDYNYMQIMVYYFNHSSPSWDISVSQIYNLKILTERITESLSNSATYGEIMGTIYTTNILYNGSPQEIIYSSSLRLRFNYNKTSVPYVKSIVIELLGSSQVVFDIILMK